MSPSQLRQRIRKLPEQLPITTELEAALAKRGTPDTSTERYSSQKEHWVGWLQEYASPGFYGRQNWQRDAEFVYNHINCPPMALWLGEASGLDRATIVKAKNAALRAQPRFPSQSSAIRRVIPWSCVEAKLKDK
jgi:hypothetical protein